MLNWRMLLRPALVVQAAPDVTPEILDSLGVRAVLIDMDDTIVASNSDELAPAYCDWVESLRRHDVPMLILSNGERSRVARCSRQLGIDGLALIGKPLGRAFRRGLKQLGTEPHETAMIGDQLFTDVLGANAAGLTSILVTPLSPGRLPHTRLMRRIERLLLKGGRP